MIFSQGMPGRHKVFFRACAGQDLTQAWQAPHWECVTGVSQVSGASVRREESLTAEPYCGVTSRLFLPIQPRPARVAIV